MNLDGFGMDLGWIWDGFGMDLGWIWDGFGMDLGVTGHFKGAF